MADEMNGERITDEMVHAALKAKNPTLYRDHLRHPANGPVLNASTEKEIQVTRKMLAAALGASLAANAGSEPVATVFTMEALTPGGGVKYHATIHKALPAGTKLYAHPSPPEGMAGWRPIASAPKDGEFLVRGGQWVGEINGADSYLAATVKRVGGDCFTVTNTDAYSAYIDKPVEWAPLPASEAKDLT